MMKPDSESHSGAKSFKALVCLLLMAAALAPVREAGAFAVFTSRAAWEAALGGAAVTTDTFDNPVAAAASITFDSGVVSSRPTLGIEDGNNLIRSGSYAGRSDPEGGNPITWAFPTSIFALGADWISTRTLGLLTISGNFDGSGAVTIDFTTFFPTAPGDGFLGIVGSAAFDAVVLGTESAVNDEAFLADNLSFVSRVVPAAAPAPAPYALMLLALAALGLRRRSRY